MRTLKNLILALALIVILVLALANRGTVTLHLLPSGMERVMPASVQVPLFVVILLAIVVGIVLGYLFEWVREHKHRRRATQKTHEARQLNRQVDQLRKETNRPEDDVLALLGNH